MKKTVFTICILLMFLIIPMLASGAGVVVPETEVKQQITDFVKNRTASLGLDVTVKKIGYTGNLQLPAGTVTYEVAAPKQWEGWGTANLALVVRVDDKVVKNIPVRVEVEAMAEVVVSTRSLERGDLVTEADVALQKRDLAGANGKICRSVSDVVGKRVKVGMRGNSAVRSDYLEKVPLVKNGQIVTMLIENGSIRITAPGRIRTPGVEGDMVTVQNLSSNKDTTARVIDSQTVQIDF